MLSTRCVIPVASGRCNRWLGDIAELRSLMMRFGIGLMVGLFSLVGALIGVIAASPLGAG